MELYIDNNFIVISKATKEEKKIIVNRFTYQDQSAAFSRGSFDKRKIKQIRFAKREKDYLLLRIGFLKELLLFIKKENLSLEEITDKRTQFEFKNKQYSYDDIRSLFNPDFDYVDHQIRSVQSLLKSNVGIVKATTGSGKTEVIIALIKLMQVPTLILVNKISLASQTMRRMNDNGLSCGICHGKGVQLDTHMVSTIQSVKKIPDLPKYKMLIIDEVHRASANTYQDFLSTTTYPLRYGFSATPEGNDKYKWATIRQYIGPIIAEVKPKELIDNKVISKPTIKFIPNKCKPTLDWPTANKLNIVNNEDRNNLIKELVLKKDEPTLILIRYIEHGEILNELIPNSIFLSGKHSMEEREEAIELFEKKELKFLISSNIFNEGISINAIKVLVIASGGKSKVETLQKLGRALRTDEGKYEALIYDFYDDGNKFTLRHSKERARIYKKAGFDVIES